MKEFINLLERKIEGCDSLGGLEREKAVYQSVLKDYKKQLTLSDVSQHRELLEAYTQFLWTQHNNLTDADNNKLALEKFIASYYG